MSVFVNMLEQKKEAKDANLVIRVTESQKKRIFDAAKEHELSTSQFILSLMALYEDNKSVKPAGNIMKTKSQKEGDKQFYNSLHEIGENYDIADVSNSGLQTIKNKSKANIPVMRKSDEELIKELKGSSTGTIVDFAGAALKNEWEGPVKTLIKDNADIDDGLLMTAEEQEVYTDSLISFDFDY